MPPPRRQVKGPIGHFTYLGRGRFEVKGAERRTRAFGLICGGTGITPAYQARTPLTIVCVRLLVLML